MCGGRYLIKLAVVRWKSIGLLVRSVPTIPVTGTGRPSLGSMSPSGWATQDGAPNRRVNLHRERVPGSGGCALASRSTLQIPWGWNPEFGGTNAPPVCFRGKSKHGV